MPGAWKGHWYDSPPKKSRRKRDSNPGSSVLEVNALTTRPTRRSRAERAVSQQSQTLDSQDLARGAGGPAQGSGPTDTGQRPLRQVGPAANHHYLLVLSNETTASLGDVAAPAAATAAASPALRQRMNQNHCRTITETAVSTGAERYGDTSVNLPFPFLALVFSVALNPCYI